MKHRLRSVAIMLLSMCAAFFALASPASASTGFQPIPDLDTYSTADIGQLALGGEIVPVGSSPDAATHAASDTVSRTDDEPVIVASSRVVVEVHAPVPDV